MSVIFHPKDVARDMITDKQLSKLVTNKLTLNKVVLRQVARLSNLTQIEVEEIALKVLKSYKKKYSELLKSGESKSASLKDALNEKKLLVNRVREEVIYKASETVKSRYIGSKYRWLPSDSEEPDPEHQLKYGKIFTIGKGEMPQDRWGCKCGMEILVDEDYTI